jgi:hypothetical protein
MENTIAKFIFMIIVVFFITASCSRKICTSIENPIDKKYLDTLSMHCNFIKHLYDNEIFLINQMDTNFIYDINTLFYYKEDNSRYIFIFNSSVFLGKYFIATIQNEKLDVYSCADLFEICEVHYPNKLVIELQDSLLQFNTLSYGLHTLKLLNKGKTISYHYNDTIIYDNNY